MPIIKRIIFLIIGTIIIVLGALGIYGVIGLSAEYVSEPFYIRTISVANCSTNYWILFTCSIL